MAKKGKLPIGLETIMGVSGRRGLKGLVNKFMAWLKSKHDKVYLDVAFVFTSPKAANVKKGFQGALIAVGTIVESIGDMVKTPEIIMELSEILFGDLPGTLQDYFEANKPDFPAGYIEPKLDADSIKLLAGQFNDLLKSWIVGILAGWDKPVQKLLGLLGHNQTEQVMTALRELEDDEWNNFNGFVEFLSPEDRDLLTQMLQFFNEPEEVKDWAGFRRDRQLEMFEFAKRMHDNRLLARMIRFGKRNWPKIHDEMASVLGQVNAGVGDLERAFAGSNAQRRAEIGRTRYTPAELKAKPWRNNELPVNDPRRQAPERRLFGLFRRSWQEVVVVFFVALVIILALASSLGGCMTKPPVVVIESAESISGEQALELRGTVQAEFLVSRVEYRINDGRIIPIKIWSARQVNWSTKIKSPVSGATITVYAYDPHAKNPGVTSIRIDGMATSQSTR